VIESSTDPQDSKATIVEAQQRLSRSTNDAFPLRNFQYIVAVVAMGLFGVAGAVLITVLRPGADNSSTIIMIFGFLAPTTLSLLSFMKSQETHLSVNSRLDGFMRNASLAARAQGREEGRTSAMLLPVVPLSENETKVEAVIRVVPTAHHD